MKAAQINSYDGPTAMVTTEVDMPIVAVNQVLVKAAAASINPFDVKVTLGYAKDWVDLKFPATLGGDVAGEVAELGADVTGFEVGQKVYGMANALSGNGSFAEYVPVDASKLAPAPTNVALTQAAAYPLVAASAYQALIETAQLQANQKILIHGGAGGIGSVAIQIARNIGAHVATTAGPDDLDYVRGLGADVALDYKSDDFSELLSDYDVVFDTVGGDTYKKSFAVLNRGGKLISMVEPPDEALAAEHGVTAIHISTSPTTKTLEAISSMIDSGTLQLNIDKQFTLDHAAEALAYAESQHVRGKIVITMS